MQFVDLKAQYEVYREEIDAAVREVIESSAFINGPAVRMLEEELAGYCGAKHVIACSSGTDALLIPLMAMDIRPGDEILVPAFTYIASASMVSLWKAVPVFIDVDPVTFTMDPEKLEEKITPRTRGIIPVSIFGQSAKLEEIEKIAKKHGLFVLEDGAQSFGAIRNVRAKGEMSCSCSHSDVASTSFFPAKPLGGYGDGGAIFTNDDELSEKIRKVVNHGQDRRYHHSVIGINGRMDTLQAAVVRVKLRHFKEELERRAIVATRYDAALDGLVHTPDLDEANSSTWAQYTIRVLDRDGLREKLGERDIPTSVHYPIPLPRQRAFADLPASSNSGEFEDYPVSDELCDTVLSLPMHAFLTEKEQELVVEAVEAVMEELHNEE